MHHENRKLPELRKVLGKYQEEQILVQKERQEQTQLDKKFTKRSRSSNIRKSRKRNLGSISSRGR